MTEAGYPENHGTITETTYDNAYNQAEADARRDHPEWSEEQVRQHAHQEAEDAIYQDYQDGITTGGEPYTDYWGSYWDSQHPEASGGSGGTPP